MIKPHLIVLNWKMNVDQATALSLLGVLKNHCNHA